MPLDMKPDIRAQWCAALRSGKYEQTREALRRNDSYCCLGVLCDLAVRAGVINDAAPARIASDGEAGRMQYDGTSQYLPPSVQKWAGLSSNDPDVGMGGYRWLSAVNDSGVTFAEIADLIDGGAE